MLLLGERLQAALGTWLARVTGLSVDWTGEERRAPAPPYIGLTAGIASGELVQVYECQPLVTALTVSFAPAEAAAGEYSLTVGATPITVRVQAEDDAPAAQARFSEAWASGLWPVDGWSLEALGAGLWRLEPPEALGTLPPVVAGWGFDLVSQVITEGRFDLTHTVTNLTVRAVFWAPLRSRLAGLRAAQRVSTLIRSGSAAEDRGADLGLSWGNRPAVIEPQLTLDGQPDPGGMVDAAALDLVVHAHTLTRREVGTLAGTRLTVTVLP